MLSQGNRSQSDPDEFDLLGSFSSSSVMPISPLQDTAPVFPQDSASQDIFFDPFAQILPSQPQTAAPTSPDLDELSPSPVNPSVPRPATGGVLPVALPPPPTKESVKAANRMKTNSGSAAPVMSPTAMSPTAMSPPPQVESPPVSQSAPSDGEKIC